MLAFVVQCKVLKNVEKMMQEVWKSEQQKNRRHAGY